MGSKIPSTIRRQVIREWLEGIPRGQIAEKNQIGAATVSIIVSECRVQDHLDIDLQREVALALRRENLSLADLASAMRLRNKMIEWGLPEDPEIEDFIEIVNVYCFKAGISHQKFIDMVRYVTSIANQLNSSVDGLPSKIQEEQKRLKSYKRRVKRMRSDHNVTKKDLSDYKYNRPLLIQENERLRTENEAYKSDALVLRKINNQQFGELFEYRYKEMISENELKKFNESWLPKEHQIPVKELNEIAHEIYYHPVKYIDVIRRIRASRIQGMAA